MTDHKSFLLALYVLTVASVCGCGGDDTTTIEQWPYTAPVKSATELGPIGFIDAIRGRDGGFSTGWEGNSVWVFGDTILDRLGVDGSGWRSSTTCSTGDRVEGNTFKCLGEATDLLGAPSEFLQFTETEAVFNTRHFGEDCHAGVDCGARYALWPGPIFSTASGYYVLYTKLIARPGVFNFKVLGSGIASWEAPDYKPVREMPVIEYEGDPLLLFGPDEPCMTSAAIVRGGYLYIYATQDAWMSQPCIVGRAPVKEMGNRTAWRFYAGDDQWVEDWREAIQVIEGSTMMSIHFNNYLNRYVAIHSAIVSADVMINVADNPWGPWSTPTLLFKGVEPEDSEMWNYSGLGHEELAEQDGKVEYVSYFRPGNWSGETRLVRVEFENP